MHVKDGEVTFQAQPEDNLQNLKKSFKEKFKTL